MPNPYKKAGLMTIWPSRTRVQFLIQSIFIALTRQSLRLHVPSARHAAAE